MKIIHAPHTVGGNAYTLSQAERQLGHESVVLSLVKTWFNYPADISLNLSSKSPRDARRAAIRELVLAYKRYDVFHFNFGQTFFSFTGTPDRLLEDVLWLRRLGKKVFMTFQGCDVRDRFFCERSFPTSACAECDNHASCNEQFNEEKRFISSMVAEHASHVYALNPDLVHACPTAEFLPYSSVDPKEWTPAGSSGSADGRVRILHSPSSRSIKGTKYVLSAVEHLKSKGYPVDLMLVENIPWAQVKQYYSRADIVVDQLLVGWYGAFAVECMALGKPVLCYLRHDDFSCVSFRDELPLVSTSKETLVDDLIKLIEDATLRKELGEKSRAFAETHHDPLRIAEKVVADYATYE